MVTSEQGEYKPVFDIQESRAKLAELSLQIETSSQQLFESCTDVLASRGGERWKDLDDISLRTNNRMKALVIVAYREADGDRSECVQITIHAPGKANYHVYEIRKYDPDNYELGELLFPDVNSEGNFTEVVNYGGLAPSRLLSYLEAGHRSTPFYRPVKEN